MAKEGSTYTLQIYVTGLALFVPEDGHTMHVLLPHWRPSSTGGCHDERPGSLGQGAAHPPHQARIYFRGDDVPFDGHSWTPVRKTDSPRADTKLPESVASIIHKLDRSYIAQGHPDVAGHLILKDGKFRRTGARVAFSVNGIKSAPLTNSLHWTIRDVPGKELALIFDRLGADGRFDTGQRLKPRNGAITLHLANLPPSEHITADPVPRECDPSEPHHFSMYGVFFPGKLLPEVRCIEKLQPTRLPYASDLPGPPRRASGNDGKVRKLTEADRKLRWERAAKVIYTCMLAQAELAPE